MTTIAETNTNDAKPARTAPELIRMGDASRDQKNWEAARASYEDALRLEPALQHIWIQLGHAAKESGDYIAAESAYRKALELNPRDPDGHLQLGHLLKLMGRWPAALESYSAAVALDYTLADAHSEIAALRMRIKTDSDSHIFDAAPALLPRKAGKQSAAGVAAIVFDISDLMSYFHNLRLPTGIQRVQMEVIKSVVELADPKIEYSIVCFTPEADFWIEIPRALFLRFCHLSIVSGDTTAPEWVSLLAELDKVLKNSPYFAFPARSFLVDLGSSWWLRNYFLNLRLAKSLYGIKYVPFMHDLIPVMTPEYCTPELRRDFLAWITGAFDHADFFLTNSQATLSDLRTVAAKLGHRVAGAAVVRLDADFRRSLDEDLSRAAVSDAARFLEVHGLKKGQYVLFVATIEARKNHIAAFSVWLKLIKKYGINNVPKLVCVGNEGWLMNAAYATLRASELLTSHVLILHRISDPLLAALYQNCLCTLYPSSYEGWGLPVTEALCYGKVPVISNISSLPESGGEFAEYFELGSENDLLKVIERLCFDEAYRTQREAKIVSGFKPRTWRDIGKQVVEQVKTWYESSKRTDSSREETRKQGIWPIKAEMGMLHGLANISDSILWAGLKSGEIYRNGRGWWWPEPWGTWIKGMGPAAFAFVLEGTADAGILVYVGLKGVPGKQTTCTLKCEDAASALEISLGPEKEHVAVLELPPTSEANRLIVITVTTDISVDFSPLTKGVDKRVTGVGVRWFYACKKQDVLARVAMAEAVALDDFRRLMPKPPARLDYFLHT